ncbi:MAG: VOC family protein [Bacteroidales bacterium]|jgi:catechol 2,3-dioxygenase-like lactoylglutathione lyase family enzyme|nr:VOC family protein [Bacteroidales bacterium]MDD3105648.1 VOC family protein [Bacteroidales bacterium]MDD3550188.1 VOC family protein [Bacteroidales bacterium]MDD3980027.1 VOC family protein [Proteiniphilum sp.]MDY0183528.1 VOC family protein [Proteiniphilum sp.]
MLHHVGLTIIEPAEIGRFYETVLHFRRLKQFTLDSEEVLHSIFSTNKQTEVYMMERQYLKLELFIDQEGEKGRFTHLCLEYDDPGEISDHAHQLGYRRWIKNGPNRVTHFIWDKSGNMFEIKRKEIVS